jgi:hypothetical protein
MGWFCGMAALLCMTVLASNNLSARDNGQFANSPLKQWFDQPASGKDLCCSFADGVSMSVVDWNAQDGHYRVRLRGEWVDVPDSAPIWPAVVWPSEQDGRMLIRCLIPGVTYTAIARPVSTTAS